MGWALCTDWLPVRRGRLRDTRHPEGRMEAEREVMPGGAGGGRALPEPPELRQAPAASPSDPQEEPVLQSPGFRTSGLPNFERRHFCCFRPPGW